MSVGVMSPMSHFGPMGHYGSMGHMGSPGATHAGGCHPVDESADVQLSTELPSEDPSVEGACGAEGQDGEMDPNATTMNPQLLEMLGACLYAPCEIALERQRKAEATVSFR